MRIPGLNLSQIDHIYAVFWPFWTVFYDTFYAVFRVLFMQFLDCF